MLPEIELDVLHFLDRTSLEGLQMHSRYFRDRVDRHARALPLRYIYNVNIKNGSALIELTEHDTALALSEADDEKTTFHRFNNSFIRRLQLSFRQENLRIFRYLQANSSVLQCQTKTLSIGDTTEGIDYALIDFLGTHLKPRVYETSMYSELREDYVMLFAHAALRRSVKHLLGILLCPPAPTCILRELFGDDVVKTCVITTAVDPRPWISAFIKTFETAERGTNMVQSVTLLDTHFYEVPQSPHHFVEAFGTPRRADAPTPHSGFIKVWPWKKLLDDGTTTNESTVAELFVFENPIAARKLEVYAWTIEHSGAWTGLSYAYRLLIVNV